MLVCLVSGRRVQSHDPPSPSESRRARGGGPPLLQRTRQPDARGHPSPGGSGEGGRRPRRGGLGASGPPHRLLPVRARRRPARRERDRSAGVVLAVGHPFRHQRAARHRARCAPASPIATGSTPRTRWRSSSTPSTTDGRPPSSPSTRSASRPTARWWKGPQRQGGGFSAASPPGARRPTSSPDFVFESKGRLTAGRLRGRGADPLQEPALPVGQACRTGACNVIRTRPEQRARGQLGARAPRGRVVPRPGGHARRAHRPAPRTRPRPQPRRHREGATARPPGRRLGLRHRPPELGGNVRWGVTPNLTLNGTVNPDFSQVEADASQFIYDPRSAIFFPEKRPFFLDGIEQFDDAEPPHLHAAHRGAGGGGQADRQGRGHARRRALGAWTTRRPRATADDHPIFNILRVQRDLGAQSQARPRLHRRDRRRRLATAWRPSTRASPSARSTASSCRARVSRTRDAGDVPDGAAVAGHLRAQRPPLRLPLR